MLLTTLKLDPNRFNVINDFDENLLRILPIDYVDFLKNYGEGTYCDYVIISYPDYENIPATFGKETELWEFDEDYTTQDLIKSIQIGWTIDGDMICVTDNRKGKVFILPRHSETITSFDSFLVAIKSLDLETVNEYFDPQFDGQIEQIKLIKNSALIDILPIHKAFLENYKYDFVVCKSTQPKYIIKEIGGWVYFDLIYKSSINIKFQKQYLEVAKPIINFLKQSVK